MVFDVNETLLDLRALDPVFQALFGDSSLRAQWFAQMLQVAFVGAITDRYVDFTTAQRAALDMVAQRRDVKLRAGDAERVAATMRALSAHPEVADALARLSAGGDPEEVATRVAVNSSVSITAHIAPMPIA